MLRVVHKLEREYWIHKCVRGLEVELGEGFRPRDVVIEQRYEPNIELG